MRQRSELRADRLARLRHDVGRSEQRNGQAIQLEPGLLGVLGLLRGR